MSRFANRLEPSNQNTFKSNDHDVFRPRLPFNFLFPHNNDLRFTVKHRFWLYCSLHFNFLLLLWRFCFFFRWYYIVSFDILWLVWCDVHWPGEFDCSGPFWTSCRLIHWVSYLRHLWWLTTTHYHVTLFITWFFLLCDDLPRLLLLLLLIRFFN